MGAVDLDDVEAGAARAAHGGARNPRRAPRSRATVSSRGDRVCPRARARRWARPSARPGRARPAPAAARPPRAARRWPGGRHGPAGCPGATPCSRYMAAIRAKPSIWPSFHRPVQPWVMRPSRVTAVASTKAAPTPPSANRAWCRRCQSCTAPSTAWYWHIGETTMRLRSSRPRRRSGVNRCGRQGAYSAACSRLPSSSSISASSSRMIAVSLATRSSPSRPSALKVVSGSRTSPTG